MLRRNRAARNRQRAQRPRHDVQARQVESPETYAAPDQTWRSRRHARGVWTKLGNMAFEAGLCRKPVVNLGCGMRALHFGELADVQWPSLRPISNPAVRTLVSGL